MSSGAVKMPSAAGSFITSQGLKYSGALVRVRVRVRIRVRVRARIRAWVRGRERARVTLSYSAMSLYRLPRDVYDCARNCCCCCTSCLG